MKKIYDQKPELNITPLVDIMLVLLAILMVTAPTMEFEEPVNLPKGSKTNQVQQFKKIDIVINNKREVVLDKKRILIKDFSDNFLLFSNGIDKKTPVYIRADKDLKYNDVMYILKTIKETGFTKVALVTDG